MTDTTTPAPSITAPTVAATFANDYIDLKATVSALQSASAAKAASLEAKFDAWVAAQEAAAKAKESAFKTWVTKNWLTLLGHAGSIGTGLTIIGILKKII